MSWVCPYQIDDFCDRLKRKCEPGIKGCVLDGRVSFIEPQKDININIKMTEINIDGSLNLKGVLCPINFVKTKLKLEEMQDGQVLELILDDGEPMQNVPRSIKEEGHRIIKVEKLTDKSFRLLIRKGG